MRTKRRLWARRSVGTLAGAVLAFAGVQVALGVAIECHLPGVRDPEYAAREECLRARLAEAPDRPLLLALGSSRLQLGLDAGRLRPRFGGQQALGVNFGLSGGGPLTQALALRRLLALGVRPARLVLEVVPATLNQPRARPVEEEWLDAARLTWDEVGFVQPSYSDSHRPLEQWLKGRAFPLLRHHLGLRCQVSLDSVDPERRPERTVLPFDAYGWSRYPLEDVTPEVRRRRREFAQIQYATSLGEFRQAAGAVRILRDTLARCRAEGIPVALLLMPEGDSFQALYTPSMRAGLDELLRGLSQEASAELIDARDWLTEDAFWDGHHLLPRGAAAFTDRFERLLTDSGR